MSEARQLEPSVMVTERNWSAMLEMQDRLFRQQMQLNADLKTLLTKQEAQETPDRDEDERCRIRKTGWEPEREVFFHLQRADREYTESCDYDFREQQTGDFHSGAGGNEENSSLRVDFNYGGDLVRGAVRLGRAVEQMTDDVPQRDASTTPMHIDSKRRKKLRQKKTALGHAEDDHEEMRMDTM